MLSTLRKGLRRNVLLVLLYYSTLFSLGYAEAWDYGDGELGPAHWGNHYKTCKSEKRQSPIDLTKPFKKDLGGIDFIRYNAVLKNPKLTNNGHTAQLYADNETSEITGGCMKDETYLFSQFHFHWGSKNNTGSEHTVDGKHFPMELHLVHINRKYSLIDAIEKANGLAVLGIFFTLESKDNPNLNPIIEALSNIRVSGLTTDIRGNLTLQTFLPQNVNKYMCYEGSLTTPACNEAVTWTVFVTPIPISEKQLKAFRELHSGTTNSSALMSNNFRPTQSLGQRKIYLYDSSPSVGFSFASLLSALLCYFCHLSLYTKAS